MHTYPSSEDVQGATYYCNPSRLIQFSRPHLQCTISTPKEAFLAELPIVALQANTHTTYPSHPTGYSFIHMGGEQQCG